jgi:2-methylisocitrate lyase-like PEP mutase family enzyme
MNAALAAGADVAFVEAPQTIEETAAVVREVNGPCLLNVVLGGKSPLIDLSQAREMGYRIAIIPALLMVHIVGACEQILQQLKETEIHPVQAKEISPREFFERVGLADWDARRMPPRRVE